MSTTAAIRPAVLADVIPSVKARDLLLVLSGTAFITLAGYIAIPLPFTPVPVSLATFAVLLTGATLGPTRGLASSGLYLALGLIGVPLFAQGASGWAFSSFGYIIGYVLATLVTGALARRRADRRVWSALTLGALGSLMIYAAGVPWLSVFLGVDFPTALLYGVVPFLVGDAIKIVTMALLLPGAWRIVDRTGRRG